MSEEAQSHNADNESRPTLWSRRYLVDRPFQFRLIGTLFSIWLANSLFFTIVLYFFYEGHLNRFYDLVPREGLLPLLTPPALFMAAIGFIAVFGVVILGIVGLYLSNQIAGPLYRTRRCFDKVGRGEWNFELQFRHGDFLRDFPGAFNAMLDGLRQQTLADIEELSAIETSTGDGVELRDRVRQLREKKEAQMGRSSETERDLTEAHETVSVAVH